MKELEKILERKEINAIKDIEEENERCNTACEGCCSDVEDGECNCRDALIIRIIEKMAEHMKDGWIPVEERLPGENGFYIATMDGEIVGQKESFVGLAEFENGKWVDDEGDYKCIIAWRTLPEPYKV